ncbi:hypothetical protein NDU88_005316 [Pleurodeles waltl]|uniref:Uncharacterized protein n=1 Tax=Pleurodeles waltl TaxID=8319 RepID=A0AAV7X0B3_PLEWA|nr:hypothetical protein NDU88_005316 [Pleurodeles waltl]
MADCDTADRASDRPHTLRPHSAVIGYRGAFRKGDSVSFHMHRRGQPEKSTNRAPSPVFAGLLQSAGKGARDKESGTGTDGAALENNDRRPALVL